MNTNDTTSDINKVTGIIQAESPYVTIPMMDTNIVKAKDAIVAKYVRKIYLMVIDPLSKDTLDLSSLINVEIMAIVARIKPINAPVIDAITE